MDLNSARPQGFVEGQISWFDIDEYAARNEFDPEQREDLFYYVRRLDEVYLEYRAKKAKK